MIITNARFASPDEQTINATVDGQDYSGIHPGVWLWSVVMESGVTVASYEPPAPPLPTLTQVIAERDRRLAAGFDFDFDDDRGVHRIGTTEGDMRGWDEVTKIALARHAVGNTTTILIVTDTGPVAVTPAEWLAILEAANTYRQPIWHASFAIQALDPIPDDYADDSRWP